MGDEGQARKPSLDGAELHRGKGVIVQPGVLEYMHAAAG